MVESLINEKFDNFQKVTKNRFLFRENEDFNGVYFIKEGRVRILKGSKPKETFMWYANKGEFIGISSYFEGKSKFLFSAVTDKTTQVIFIPKENFSTLMDEKSDLKVSLIQILCNRIEQTENRLSLIKKYSVKERFNKALLSLIEVCQNNHKNVKVSFTMNELAQLTGCSKQYIRKLLYEYQKNKILKLSNSSCLIYNTGALV